MWESNAQRTGVNLVNSGGNHCGNATGDEVRVAELSALVAKDPSRIFEATVLDFMAKNPGTTLREAWNTTADFNLRTHGVSGRDKM